MTWSGQQPCGHAGKTAFLMDQAGEVSSVIITRAPSRPLLLSPGTQDPQDPTPDGRSKLEKQGPAMATPTGAQCFPQHGPSPGDAGAGTARNPCIQEPRRTASCQHGFHGCLGSQACFLLRDEGLVSVPDSGSPLGHRPCSADASVPLGSWAPSHGLQRLGAVDEKTGALSGSRRISVEEPARHQPRGSRGHGPRKQRGQNYRHGFLLRRWGRPSHGDTVPAS